MTVETFDQKCEKGRWFGRLECRLEHNTKFKPTESGDMDQLDMPQNSTQHSYKYNNETLYFIKVVEFLEQLNKYWLLNEGLVI